MRRLVNQLLAAVLAATAVAACGDSTKPDSHPKQPNVFAVVRCMRANGMPHLPDPSGRGGFGAVFSAGGRQTAIVVNGENFGGPVFQTALTKCHSLLPKERVQPTDGQPSAAEDALLLKQAKCMRSHDVPNWPDPGLPVPASLIASATHAWGPAERNAMLVCKGERSYPAGS
jgi:hypothetical protein